MQLFSVVAALLVSAPASVDAQLVRFRRGDSNADARLDVSDAIYSLGFLFLGGPRPPCTDAADSNDDGRFDVSDSIHWLGYLFLGTASPPRPGPRDCGFDPTDDSLDCLSYDHCPQLPDPPPPSPPVVDPLSRITAEASVSVAGSASPPAVVVEVSGGDNLVTLALDAGAFAGGVPLRLNQLNTLYFTALTASGDRSAPAVGRVVQDQTPPSLFIDSPADGSETTTDTVTVVGRVGDLLSGFMGLIVLVNNSPAEVRIGIGTNGTYERAEVPLAFGDNTITVRAMDAVGNSVERSITVRRRLPEGPRLLLVDGNGQQGGIGSVLAAPLSVRVENADGSAFSGKIVTFQVVRSNGLLGVSADEVGERTLQVRTDLTGAAQVFLRLGSDAGCGNNRVTAISEGVDGTALFCASALPATPDRILVSSGNNQRAEAEAQLREPLRVWVSDGCNGAEGVPVIFSVVQGTGTLDGDAREVLTLTSATGHAEVIFVLGPEPGNHIVEASFVGNPGLPATFVATAVVRDLFRPTSFQGVVLDNGGQPIGGAECTLSTLGATYRSFTDGQGQFEFFDVESGPAHVHVNGLTATRRGGGIVLQGTFPALSYAVVVVPNAENTLPAPVLLPDLDPANVRPYSTREDTVLEVAGMEGLRMVVKAGSMRLHGESAPDGTLLALNQVHHDDVPMPMPDGASPPFAWTLQPAGAHFDPPVEIEYPNLSGLAAGSIAYFLSFNHDTERFEIVASGHVTEDGTAIVNDPGAGIDVAGWGCNCPPYSVTGDAQNCCRVAVAIFRGGLNVFNVPASRDLELLRDRLIRLDRNRVNAMIISPAFSADAQLRAASRWFDQRARNCRDLSRILIGHSLGGDTVFLSDSISAVQRYMIDPISRQLAVSSDCFWYQRHLGPFPAPNRLVRNFLRDTALTEQEIEDCNTAGCPIPGTREFREQFNRCITGYPVFPPDLNWVVDGTNHDSVVPAVTEDIAVSVGTILGAGNGAGLENTEALLDETWTLSVGGRSVQLEGDGAVRVSNIPAPDQFGAGGPGTAPDFVSDDFVQLTGVSTAGGVTRYASSEFFRLRQGGTVVVEDIRITDVPLDLVRAITLDVQPRTLGVDETAQAVVTATLADGRTGDVTGSNNWTTYRTSRPDVVAISEDGLVTARRPGLAVVVASNSGATASRAVRVREPDPLTVVEGRVLRLDGSPFADALVAVRSESGTDLASARSNSAGAFSLAGVPTERGSLTVHAEAQEGGETLRGASRLLLPVRRGVTDAGDIFLLPPYHLSASNAQGVPGETVVLRARIDNGSFLHGWAFGLCHDPGRLSIESFEPGAVTETVNNGQPPTFLVIQEDSKPPAVGVVMAVVVDFAGQVVLPAGTGHDVLDVTYRLAASDRWAPEGATDVCPCSGLRGTAQPIAVQFTADVGGAAVTVLPDLSCGRVTLLEER
jgi:hypothetical protein